MKLSEDKISHLAHILKKSFTDHQCGQIESESKTLNLAKDTMTTFFKMDDLADDKARKKILGYSKSIPEGSREWDILYQKHYEYELNKLLGS